MLKELWIDWDIGRGVDGGGGGGGDMVTAGGGGGGGGVTALPAVARSWTSDCVCCTRGTGLCRRCVLVAVLATCRVIKVS